MEVSQFAFLTVFLYIWNQVLNFYFFLGVAETKFSILD